MSLDKLTSKAAPSTRTEQHASRKRSWAWLLPCALLLGFGLILFLLFGERLRPAVDVTTAPVITVRASAQEQTKTATKPSTGRGQLLFQASGWVEPDPYVTYVPTLINGIVKDVHVLEGAHVKQGDLLATLVDDDAVIDLREAKHKVTALQARIKAHCAGVDIRKAELDAAQKKIDSAQAQVAEAEDHLARLQKVAPGAISRQQLVQAKLSLQQARAAHAETQTAVPRIEAQLRQIDLERLSMLTLLQQLETAQDRAQLALDRTRITSPTDGVVLHLHVAPGKKRMLDMDDPKSAVIVELYQINKLQARVDVPLNEAAALAIGQQVELISDLLPDHPFKGQVTRITGEADLQRNTLQAKVAITNPDPRLRPEMLVRAKFFSHSNKPNNSGKTTSGRLSIYVPEGAIISNNKVWVINAKQRAELRTLELGQDTRDGHRIALSGIRSGERVILPPHNDLSDGTRVRPQTQP